MICSVTLFLVALHQECTIKGTQINGAIRHYFGLNYFVEYTAQNPELIQNDLEVPICDYKTMTEKEFLTEFVGKTRPCLFKGYGRSWPAYEKWQNETYLRETSG